MDPKTLNAVVHDHDAATYDDRFLIAFDAGIGDEVRRELRDLLGSDPAAHRALDVGCGTGYLAAGLAAAGLAREVHACDLSAGMLARARENLRGIRRRRVRLACCDGERLPYADARFDLVVARGALHHLPDPLAALREMRRVMAPGGAVVVTAEPTPEGEAQVAALVGSIWRGVEALRRFRRRAPDPRAEERTHWELASMAANLHTFRPAEIVALAEKAGFEDITVRTASWAWVLGLGVHYYLAGEFARTMGLGPVRRAARAGLGLAAGFDRFLADRVLPSSWRHTIQAVLR